MHFPVETNVLRDVASITFHRAAVVVKPDPSAGADHPVGNAGQKSPQQGVPARVAPAADDIVAFLEFGQYSGNVLRVILQISVQRDQGLAPSVLKAGSHGCCLTEVSNEFENADPVIGTLQFPHHLETSIRAAVVNDENLVGFFQGPEHAGQVLIKGPEALLLVEDRNENGEIQCGLNRFQGGSDTWFADVVLHFVPEYTQSTQSLKPLLMSLLLAVTLPGGMGEADSGLQPGGFKRSSPRVCLPHPRRRGVRPLSLDERETGSSSTGWLIRNQDNLLQPGVPGFPPV